MYCLYWWFRVFTYHICFDSNPDIGPELSGHLLDSFVLHFSSPTRKYSYSLSSAQDNEKSSYPTLTYIKQWGWGNIYIRELKKNNLNSALGFLNSKHCLRLHYSQRKLKRLFLSLSVWSLLIAVPGRFLYRRVSLLALYRLSFWLKLVWKTSYLYCFLYLDKTYFLLYIIHFSVNFTWFELFSTTKKLIKNVFTDMKYSIWFAEILTSPKNYFCGIKIIFAMNIFQTLQGLHYYKENLNFLNCF